MNPAFEHLFESSALNGVGEGYLDSLLILILVITTEPEKTANENTKSNGAP